MDAGFPVDVMKAKHRRLGRQFRSHGAQAAVGRDPAGDSELDAQIGHIVSTGWELPIVSVEQGASLYKGRNSSGIATCTLGTGERRLVFWKRGAALGGEAGLRLGCVGYEIGAYLNIRNVAHAPAPALIGGESCGTDALLVIEHVEHTSRIHKSTRSGVMMEHAARRIGTFQRRASAIALDGRLDDWDEAFFDVWALRAARRYPSIPTLKRVADGFPSFVASIQATSSTLIHGELYPRNVLVSADDITAIDWEWAGLGMGEIDLAALTEGRWGETTTTACEFAYAESRGIDPADELFRQRLAASRLYFHLRWFGWGDSARSINKTAQWRLEQVGLLGKELGFL